MIAIAAGWLIMLAHHALLAQSGPSLSADATIGGGAGRGGEFFDRGIGGARLALSIRGAKVARVAPYTELAMDWLSFGLGGDAICAIGPRGNCLPRFPALSGPEVTVGAVVRPGARLEVRGGVGGGAYQVANTRVGGVLGQVDAAVFPVQHVGVVVGGRAVIVPRYRGDRLWTLPWAVGLRFR
jgi:hypothetical protein